MARPFILWYWLFLLINSNPSYIFFSWNLLLSEETEKRISFKKVILSLFVAFAVRKCKLYFYKTVSFSLLVASPMDNSKTSKAEHNAGKSTASLAFEVHTGTTLSYEKLSVLKKQSLNLVRAQLQTGVFWGKGWGKRKLLKGSSYFSWGRGYLLYGIR